MNPHRLNVSQDASRLSAEDRRSLQDQLTAINQVDAAVYAHAELQCERLIHRWKKSLFDLSRPSVPQHLRVGETVVLTMAEPLVGDGWHEREGGIHAACRWAGPQRCSSLYFAVVPDGTFEVTLWLPSVISDEVLAGLVVSINGVPAAHLITARAGFQVVTASVSLHDADATCLHVELAFFQTASAWETAGVADHRQKTVAVERVEVRKRG